VITEKFERVFEENKMRTPILTDTINCCLENSLLLQGFLIFLSP